MSVRLLAALAALLLAFVGCDEEPATESVGPSPAASEDEDASAPCEPGDPADPALAVTLDEYRILPDEDELTRGPARFRALNSGEKPHDLYVVEGRSIEAIPLDRKGSVDMERLEEEGRILGEIEGIPPGRSCDLEVDLDPGTYVLLCDIRERGKDGVVNHFLQGMRARFKVS